ncbi:MAG: hypothetical protein AAGE94_11790 [Acidobacteriota bacterium]
MAKSRPRSKPARSKKTPPKETGPRRVVEPVLWTAAALAVISLFFLPLRGFPMNEISEIRAKTALFVAVLALVGLRTLARGKIDPKKAGGALALAAVLAAGCYVNFGAFHGRTYIHYWEHFHYTLGAKYFAELGYDGLYAASLEAQGDTYPLETIQPVIRDLRTNKVVSSGSIEVQEHRDEVRQRFTDDRWERFVEDHRVFLDNNDRGYLAGIRRDHGFNPPPSWTFVARLFVGWLDIDDEGDLVSLAHVDLILLIAMFVVVFQTWGTRVGSLSLVLFGLGYAGRYYWVGGAFLREDWLAAMVIGICMLKRERFGTAGAAFGYAAAVRLFPVLFMFGPGIVALRALARRESWSWVWKLIGGWVAAFMVLVLLGSLTGRGFGAWTQFADSISLHRQTWLTNNVGLDNVLLYDKATMNRDLVDFQLPEPWIHWQAKMDGLKHDRAAVLWAARLAFLALLAAAAWKAKPEEAATMSLGAVFALVLTTCYYWQALLILPFLGSWPVVWGALALNIVQYALHYQSPAFELRYGLMSWGLLVLFVGIYAPRVKALVDSWRADTSEGTEAPAEA